MSKHFYRPYQSEEWRHTARRIKKQTMPILHPDKSGRDKAQCEGCGERLSLAEGDVHHRHYKGGLDPWEYPDEAFAVFCDDCHERHTMVDNLVKRMFGMLSLDRKRRVQELVESLVREEEEKTICGKDVRQWMLRMFRDWQEWEIKQYFPEWWELLKDQWRPGTGTKIIKDQQRRLFDP